MSDSEETSVAVNNNEMLIMNIIKFLQTGALTEHKVPIIASEDGVQDNNDNEPMEMEVDSEEPEKVDDKKGGRKKVEDRKKQMAKNREYARKCVQKKKNQRKDAEIRSKLLVEETEMLKKLNEVKERNSNFAVELLKLSDDMEMVEKQKRYEAKKEIALRQWDLMASVDETININYSRLEDAKEEFKKASDDLREKKGVIGTLGSRKIRAKQHMEWRSHLYNISLLEQQLRKEKMLETLVHDYVLETVPRAAPLVKTIPKQMLNELIKSNRTLQLEEFIRFVESHRGCLFDENVTQESRK